MGDFVSTGLEWTDGRFIKVDECCWLGEGATVFDVAVGEDVIGE